MVVYVSEKVAIINETNGIRIDGQNQAIQGIEQRWHNNVVSVVKDDTHNTWNITLADESVIMYSQANYNIMVMGNI